MAALITIFLILFTSSAIANQDEGRDNFLKTCLPFTCGSGAEALDIRFPLRLRSAPAMCGLDGLELTCSANNETILSLPSFPPLKVTNINYGSSEFTVKLPKSDNSPCPLQNLSSLVHKLSRIPNYSSWGNSLSFVRCPGVSGKVLESANNIAGPIPSCYADSGYSVYVVDNYLGMGSLPHDCGVFWTGGAIPEIEDVRNSFIQWVHDFSETGVVRLFWDNQLARYFSENYECEMCEWRGKHCGFDWGRNQSFCDSHHAIAHQDEGPDDFLKTCQPFTCGTGSEALDIRFPLRLKSAPVMCGDDGLELTCSSNNETILSLPSLPPLKVTNIDYRSSEYTIKLPKPDNSPCPLQNLSSLASKLGTPIYYRLRRNWIYYPLCMSISFVRCPAKFAPPLVSGMDFESVDVAGPVPSCFTDSNYSVYVVDSSLDMHAIPHDCEVFWTGGMIPSEEDPPYSSFNQLVQDFSERREVRLFWGNGEVNYKCQQCEQRGKHCGFDWGRDQSFCISQPGHHGANVFLIVGISIGGLLVILAVLVVLFYVSRLSAREKETRLKVEKFLATYKTSKPTRYTYPGIKKITKRFRYKLGQGGFGIVYKGELPNGIPVAVKMLENTKGKGEEFINEVATIGRIHHFNVVRLLGFCSEGTRRALIYEFMPNESLEKFIFSKETKSSHGLSMEKILEIAIGIARGIEYLHQGCDQRILHFDIKPHNILLDHNFVPKVSDFGLAKLCSRDQSFITMTAARGTMGYIAPEIYSRNFGEVSYKSDVYSFGMLLLEMVSGKRTVEPSIENQDEDYFPEWIYNQLINGKDLGLVTEKREEEDMVKKLVIVALWCIQWSPNDRPTMTKLIQLLIGNLESLQIPPRPFISA